MRSLKSSSRSLLGAALTVVVLGAIFYFKAQQNYTHQDPTNSNFFSFYLSGRMVWTGENPYDAAQWLHGFDAVGATYRPSRILQYPLPLMYFMAPLGLLPVRAAYFAWQIFCQLVIAFSAYSLLRNGPARLLLFLPLVVFLLFFGPVYLTLQVGSIGALSLLALTLAILLLEHKRPILAGVALSLTLLKPPQALTLLLLAGIWLLASRQWRVIVGMLLGGFGLLIVWMLRDPLWLVKFRGSSDFLLGHTLGVQSNVFGFAYLACGRAVNCMWIVGSLAALAVVMFGALYLWRNRARLSPWEALNVIIPLGFVSAIYLWSYDQLLYVLPIVWIASRLRDRTHSYLPPFLFLLAIDVVSFVALAAQATTQRDLLSILTTLLVLGFCLVAAP